MYVYRDMLQSYKTMYVLSSIIMVVYARLEIIVIIANHIIYICQPLGPPSANRTSLVFNNQGRSKLQLYK